MAIVSFKALVPCTTVICSDESEQVTKVLALNETFDVESALVAKSKDLCDDVTAGRIAVTAGTMPAFAPASAPAIPTPMAKKDVLAVNPNAGDVSNPPTQAEVQMLVGLCNELKGILNRMNA